MRGLLTVHGAILVPDRRFERLLSALRTCSPQPASTTPLSKWSIVNCDLEQGGAVLISLGVPFLVLMDRHSGNPFRLAQRLNTVQSPPWWAYFRFPEELEDAVVGTHPEHTAGYLKKQAPFATLYRRWASAPSQKTLRQHLAGSGPYKDGVGVEEKLRELSELLNSPDTWESGTVPRNVHTRIALLEGLSVKPDSSHGGLRGSWSDVPFSALVEDCRELLDRGSPRQNNSPDMRRLVTLLLTDLRDLTQLLRGTDLNV